METHSEPIGAVLYTRVSTSGQADKGTSLADQLVLCQKKARDVGVPVVGHFEDAGVSGSLYRGRRGLQGALAEIEARRADILIIANMTRYSRDREHQSAIKKRVEIAGGRLVFCDMTFEDTPEGDLAFGIMGTFAEYERQVIRSRTMKGRRRRAEEGLQPSRAMSPMGYHIVTSFDVLRGFYDLSALGTYVVVTEEAHWVKEIFTRYASGMSLRGICRWLNTAGVPTRRNGKFWRPNVINRMLDNPVYKGRPAFGVHQTFHDESRLDKGLVRTSFARKRPEDQWVFLDAPAIVDEATWNECSQRQKEAQAVFGGDPERRYLLTGLIRCPICDRGMVAWKRSPGDRDVRTKRDWHYECPDSRPSRNAAGIVCNPQRVDGSSAESIVLKSIREISRKPEHIRVALEQYRRRQRPVSVDSARVRLEAQLRSLDRDKEAILTLQINAVRAGVDSGIYFGRLREITSRRNDVEKELASLPGSTSSASPVATLADDEAMTIMLQAVDVALFAPEVTTQERYSLLTKIVSAIYPDGPDTFRIALRPLAAASIGPVPNILINKPPTTGRA